MDYNGLASELTNNLEMIFKTKPRIIMDDSWHEELFSTIEQPECMASDEKNQLDFLWNVKLLELLGEQDAKEYVRLLGKIADVLHDNECLIDIKCDETIGI